MYCDSKEISDTLRATPPAFRRANGSPSRQRIKAAPRKKMEKQEQRQLKHRARRNKTAIPRKKRVRKGSFDKKKAADRGSRIDRQRKQKIEQMLSELSTQCSIGTRSITKATTTAGAAGEGRL